MTSRTEVFTISMLYYLISSWRWDMTINTAIQAMFRCANQALLDALALARGISKGCGAFSNWKEVGLRESVLIEFEAEMLKRSASKVEDSAEAAQFLHSDVVLHQGDEPRGRCLNRDDE